MSALNMRNMRKCLVLILSISALTSHADGGYDPNNGGGYDPSLEKKVEKKVNPKSIAFKDYVIGETSIDDKWIRFRFQCIGQICTLRNGENESIANSNIQQLILKFDDTKTLASMTIIIQSSGFDRAAKAMVQKYGKPKSAKVEALQNGYGAKFNSRKLEWDRNGVYIFASEFSDANTSLIMFATHAELQKLNDIYSKPDI